jgi:GNAT superfamily N-acetyltransferase
MPRHGADGRVDDCSLIIQPMQLFDQEEVARLFHAVWHETHAHLQDPLIAQYRNLAFFQNRIRQRAERTLVARTNGRLAGFSCWTGAHFDSLFVSADARSDGIGAALLFATESRMRETTSGPLDLYCVVGNDSGRRFYERHGWRVVDEKEKPSETPGVTATVSTWVMQK